MGEYVRKVWKDGDIITAKDLNHQEEGIKEAVDAAKSVDFSGLQQRLGFDSNGVLGMQNGGLGATNAADALKKLGIVVSATEPANPTDGMIWFKIGG